MLQVLPISKGQHLKTYQRQLESVKQLRRHLSEVETYAWHGTSAEVAHTIAMEGFDMGKVGTRHSK